MINNHDADADVGLAPMVPTEGPIIVPLITEKVPSRQRAIFDVIARDLSEDVEGWMTGKPREKPTRSEHYRKTRQEFVCFCVLIGFVVIVSIYTIATMNKYTETQMLQLERVVSSRPKPPPWPPCHQHYEEKQQIP